MIETRREKTIADAIRVRQAASAPEAREGRGGDARPSVEEGAGRGRAEMGAQEPSRRFAARPKGRSCWEQVPENKSEELLKAGPASGDRGGKRLSATAWLAELRPRKGRIWPIEERPAGSLATKMGREEAGARLGRRR